MTTESAPIRATDLRADHAPGVGPATDLLVDGQVLTIVGEEGQGKSTLGWQIGGQLCAGVPIGGFFDVPAPVAPVLIIDVEQSEDDAAILRDDMTARGLSLDGVYWLDATGRALDLHEDQKWLTDHIRALRPQVVTLDTGTEAVTAPQDDKSVKPLFIYLHRLLKAEGVRTVLLLAQPRKRGSGEPMPRGFDDLYGSRVWKGRSSAVLYLDEGRLTVWKQRGKFIERRWGSKIGRFVRHDDRPSLILPPVSDEDAASERRSMVLLTVGMNPGQLSKTALIESELNISGHARAPWRKTVDALITDGSLAVDGQYNRLVVATPPGVGGVRRTA